MATGRTSVTSLLPILDFGRYQILGRLAVGGMAEIYLAREPLPTGGERHIVLKRVLPHAADDPRFAEMFLDEARVAMRLSHPGICHVYEFGEQGGTYYLAMEWVNGVSLGKLIRRAREHGGIPTAIAVKVIAQVADALHYAHQLEGDDGGPLNIVHRDVSPGNIMVAYGGSVRLLDFGIAKAELSHARTSEGQVKGKFAYMSPQHCRGEKLDARADVFSLGVCLYEAVTGRPLYHRKNEYDIMRAVIEEPVPSIRSVNEELPEALDAVVKRCLAKEPEQRWESAAEVQEALERWLAGSGQVVHTGRIKEYLAQLFADDISRGPSVDSTPFGKSFHSFAGARPHGVPGVPDLPEVDSQTFEVTVEGVMPVLPERRRPWALWAALGVLALSLLGGGLFLYARLP
ncbi:MAG: serine/threonine protein kinase, partial [Deltaproteobacteria bacterium]|nr:serine/threonine protein kinase [Deltaproteobacteria bacterium]